MSTRRKSWDLVWRRLVQAAPVVLFATFVVFSLLKLVPGDIAVTLAGENATEQRIVEIRQLYGLDRPFLVQYGSWLLNAVQGNLSASLLSGEPVLTSIERCLPKTMLIVVMSLLLSLILGLPIGMLAASRPGSRLDRALMTSTFFGVAVPSFWLAMILVSIFALKLNWFPATGSVALSDSPTDAIRHAALPALALAFGGVAQIAQQLRSSLAEILSSQYVRTLRAKGLSPSAILWKHGLKNVSVNLLTVIALLANKLLGATVVIETVFAIPGMGSLIINAALQRDYPVIQGVVFAMVLIVIAINFSVDVLYRVVDPRVQTS